MRYTIPLEAAIPNSQTRDFPERAPRGPEQRDFGAVTLTGEPFQVTYPPAADHRGMPPEVVSNNVTLSA